MHITNVESFKVWLVENIRPLCDADPFPLSKYVLALVKKDKDEKELKSICNDQLDVFFQENTVEFVEKLFQVLKDESYQRPAPPAAPPAQQAAVAAEDEQRRSATKRKAASPSLTPAPQAAAAAAGGSMQAAPQQQQQQPVAPAGDSLQQPRQHHPPDSKVARVSSKSGSAAETTARKQPPVPIQPPSPPPPQQQQQQRQPAAAAPASAASSQPSRSSGGGSGNGQPPKDLRNALNSRSSGGRQHHHLQQQQQHSATHHQLQQPQSAMTSAPAGGFHHHPQQAPPFLPPPLPPPTSSAAVGFYPAPLPPPPQPHLLVPPHHLGHPQQRPRCRDYDEKGVCLLGAACPYDHGAHPLTVAPGDPAYGKFFGGPPGGGVLPPPPPPTPQSVVASQHRSSMMQPSYSAAPLASTASLTSDTQVVMLTQPQLQQQQPRPAASPPEPGVSLSVAAAPAAAPTVRIVQPIALDGDSAGVEPRAPPGRQHRGGGGGSCTLELRRVPSALNNLTTLSGHFSRFGTIVDIDIAEPESARVTFASPAEALAAYRSPEAVLNNRFIRVFLPGAGGQRQSAKERLGARQHQPPQGGRRLANLRQTSDPGDDENAGAASGASDDLTAAAPSRASLTWTPQSSETAAKAAETAAAAAAERRQEGARIQQAQQAALERAKAHRELRVKQISMLKDCKESLAKLGNLFARAKDADARHAIAETMKPINAQIRDLEASLGVVSTGSAALRDLQKELLDLELEVYQKEGLEPVAEQKKRLAEVRKLLAARLPPKPAPAAAPVPNFAQTRLDKRSRTLRVQGHAAAQVEELLRYIAAQAGVKPQRHHQCPDGQLLVDFAGRADAEAAMARLKHFEDKPLKVDWSQQTAAAAAPAAPAAGPSATAEAQAAAVQ